MVRDWEVEPHQPMMEMQTANVRMKNNYDVDQSQAEPEIGFRKIKLQAQITAQFEIK
jgi:hypothetical protein